MGIYPTLPTLYSTGFNAGYRIGYWVIIALSDSSNLYLSSLPNITPTVDVKYDGVSIDPDNYYYRTQYLAAEIDGNPVEGIGEIDFGLNIEDGGGLGARSEASVVLLNMPHLSYRMNDTLMQYDIENKNVEIWESYIPSSGVFNIDTDSILRFRGVVRDGITWDSRTLIVRAVDRRDVDSLTLPRFILNRSNMGNVPKENIGKPLPIVIGDFLTTHTSTYFGGTITAAQMGFFKLLPLIKTSHLPHYLTAGHAVDEVGDRIYYMPTEDGTAVGQILAANVTVALDSAGRSKVFITESPYSDMFLLPTVPGARNVYSAANVEKVNSDDVTNYLTINTPGNVLSLQLSDFGAVGQFVRDWTSDASTPNTDLTVRVYAANVSGTIDVRLYDWVSGTVHALGTLSNGLNIYDFTSMLATIDPNEAVRRLDAEIYNNGISSADIYRIFIQARVKIQLNKTTALRSPSTDRPFYDFLGRRVGDKKIYYKTITEENSSVFSQLFWSGKGAEYGSWIDTGRTVGYSSGGFIENPAYAVEYLLRTHLGIAAARIDTDSFDVVGNSTDGTRKDWKIRGGVTSVEDGMEVIRRICNEFGMKLFFDHDSTAGTDTYRLIAIPSGNIAEDYTITESDILADNGIPTLLEVSKTSQSQVSNSLRMLYDFDYSTGTYRASIFMEDDDGDDVVENNLSADSGALRGTTYTSWMEESISTYNRVLPFEQELSHIGDSATAELKFKLLADWFAFQRLKVRVRVLKTLDTVRLRTGDIVKMDAELMGNQIRNFMPFIIDRINFPGVGFDIQPYIDLELQEIPNALTGAKLSIPLLDRHTIVS